MHGPAGPAGGRLGPHGVVFTAVMMFVIGLFQFFGGIGAIVQDDVYVLGEDA
jgi:hypothetical protein